MASRETSWKWMVFTSRCCLKIIAEGTGLSFGILLPALTEHFGSSSSTVGFILSFHTSLWYLGAPLAKLLLDHCSRPRTLTTTCGFLAGLSVICAAFTSNISLFGSLLICSALCGSVLQRQAPLLLHQYFPTDFAFISTSTFFGTITGGLVVPQMVSLSLMAYGVSGAILIIGGIFLNLLPIGYALKAPYSNKDLHGDNESEETTPLISEPKGIIKRVTKSESGISVSGVGGDKLNSTEDKNHLHDYLPVDDMDITVTKSDTRDFVDDVLQISDKRCCKESEGRKESGKEARRPQYSRILKGIPFIDFLVNNALVSCTLIPSVGIIFIVIGGWDLFEVTYGISQGLDLGTARFIPMASVAGCTVSHIVFTIILRYQPKWCVFIFLSCCCWMTLGFFVTTMYSSLFYILVVSFATGIGANGVVVTYEGVVDSVVDAKYFADGSTLTDLLAGLGILMSGFVAGFIKDVTGSTKLVYWTLGGMNLVACFLIVVLVLNMSCSVSRKH